MFYVLNLYFHNQCETNTMYVFLIWWFTDDDPVVFEIIWPRHLFDLGNNSRRINVLSLQVKMLIQTPFYSFTCRFSWKKYEIQIVCFKYNIYKINNIYIYTYIAAFPSLPGSPQTQTEFSLFLVWRRLALFTFFFWKGGFKLLESCLNPLSHRFFKRSTMI